MDTIIQGHFADIPLRQFYPAEIQIRDGRIASIKRLDFTEAKGFIIPGFIDSHVHIESSMLVPSEFARLAVTHGTVATVSDPHEIANVCGMEGIEFMISNGNQVPFKFYFGAPSCVPATIFETAGAELNAEAVKRLLQRDEVKYLSEMMNFPGVLNDDPEVIKKIQAAKDMGKPVDGHAPGLTGSAAKKYIDAGISTDHECFGLEEARSKLESGMKILIREGSAAKNFDALIDLLNEYPDKIMFCSDDKHPDSLVNGHINDLCRRAVQKGIDIFNILKAACVNPVLHYKLEVGLLKEGDPADFIIINNPEEFKVLKTFIAGVLVAEEGLSLISSVHVETPVNNFHCDPVMNEMLIFHKSEIACDNDGNMMIIGVVDGQLITEKHWARLPERNDEIFGDVDQDILKIVVVNRYEKQPISKAFAKNFGLKSGAIASSVAHDSHNIIAVGVDDEALALAINAIIQKQGGISCVNGSEIKSLALPVAGLMTSTDGYETAAEYTALDAMAKSLGSSLGSPFMSLSFMALLVIPHLKLSDLGLFDGDEFKLIHSGRRR